MKDFFGNDLNIGDPVAFCKQGYRELVMGEVIGFTPKQVRVKYKRWSHSTDPDDTYLNYPDFFIKKITLVPMEYFNKTIPLFDE